VFLTGSAAEIVPVVKVDERLVGDGRPGPVTKELTRLFRAYAPTHGVRI
jgi:branched-chain amino acid aminotransferase